MRLEYYRKPSEAQGGLIDRRLLPYRNGGVYVTWRCNLHCPYCAIKDRRAANPTYEMTRAEFDRIVTRLKMLNWPLRRLNFTGGEPGLWPHLKWAINHARCIAERIIVDTNGMACDPQDLAGADEIRITNYGAANRHAIHELRRVLGRRVTVTNPAQVPLRLLDDANGSLPAHCRCVRLYFVGDRVYPCAMSRDGMSVEDDFLSDFCRTDPQLQDQCVNCLGNRSLRYRPGLSDTLEIGLWDSNRVGFLQLRTAHILRRLAHRITRRLAKRPTRIIPPESSAG